MPYVQVGRGARLKRVVIDRGVEIPEGLVVGEDPILDAERFRRTEFGHLPHHPADDRRAGGDAMIDVLAVASEYYPLVKTGGLADVTGALPGRAQAAWHRDAHADPRLSESDAASRRAQVACMISPISLAARRASSPPAISSCSMRRIFMAATAIPIWGPTARTGRIIGVASQGWGLRPAKSAGGSIAEFKPRIVHAHDWQAALAPVYLRFWQGTAKSVLTIHNLSFQGQFPSKIFSELRLAAERLRHRRCRILWRGRISQRRSRLGRCHHDGESDLCRRDRHARIWHGSRWHDPGAPSGGHRHRQRHRHRDLGSGHRRGAPEKLYGAAPCTAATNKQAIEQRFGLERDDGPLFCVVSRLTWQKGMDILADTLDSLVAHGARLALLGSGEAWLEQTFATAAQRHRGRIGVIAGYDENLSHLLQGGSDAILIPSRFEPCGLTQLYGLRYGCVPVVAQTGGLADTIIDANDAAISAGVASGLHFAPADAGALEDAITRAVALYREPQGLGGDAAHGHEDGCLVGEECGALCRALSAIARIERSAYLLLRTGIDDGEILVASRIGICMQIRRNEHRAGLEALAYRRHDLWRPIYALEGCGGRP